MVYLRKKNTVTFFYVVLTLGLLVASIFFGNKANNLQKELGQANLEVQRRQVELQTVIATNTERLEKMRDYKRSVRTLDYNYVNVVLFGPRDSGKTSLVDLWCKPWADISTIAASSTWSTYEFSIHEFKDEQRFDPLFDVESTYVPTLRLRIWDYPGDDRYRVEAVKRLEEVGGPAVAVLILKVGFDKGNVVFASANSSYYSMVFTEEIRKKLASVTQTLNKVFIVFNKSDLLPPTWDEETMLTMLKKENIDAIQNIERIFSGKSEYYLTSARTNYGLISLLGNIGSVAINSDDEMKRYIRSIQRFEHDKQDLEQRKGT